MMSAGIGQGFNICWVLSDPQAHRVSVEPENTVKSLDANEVVIQAHKIRNGDFALLMTVTNLLVLRGMRHSGNSQN